MAAIPKMLSIKQASAESGVSYECIRQWCIKNEIPHKKAGSKYLINADKFADYLNGEGVEEIEKAP